MNTRDLRPVATAAVAASTGALAVSFVRVFEYRDFLPSLLLVAAFTHVVAFVTRWLRWPALVALGAQAIAVWTVTAWARERDTLWYGLPLGRTWDAVAAQISASAELIGDVKPPLDMATGFGLVACLAIGAVAALSDTFAFRAAGRGEALVPGSIVFVVIAIVGEDRHRVMVTAVWLGCALLAVAALRRDAQRPVAALAIAATVALMAGWVGPSLPGAGEPAILGRDDGPGRVVEPLVDVRGRLGDRSDTVLFTVSADEPSYWRLTSLSEFDGATWGISQADLDSAGGELAESRSTFARMITQTYEIAGLEGNMAPSVFEPVQLRAASRSLYYESRSGTLLVGGTGLQSGDSYQMASEVVDPPSAVVAGVGVDRPPSTGLVDLPSSGQMDELRRIALDVTAGAATPFEKALRLQNYFRDGFTYSLDAPSITDEDAFLEFISRRTGYCEQFASTFAVMARSIGLPTRVALGFTPGQSDGNGGYVVRSRHAHAWPEVWFDDLGWLLFEPTPGRGAPNTSYTGVVPQQDEGGPDPTEPTTTTLAPPTSTAGSTPTTVTGPPPSTGTTIPTITGSSNVGPGLLAMVLVVLALAAWPFVVRAWVARLARRHPRHPVLVLWRRMIAESGVSPSRTSTPSEVAATLTVGDDEVPRRLARAVELVLFAERDPDDLAELTDAVEVWITERRSRVGRSLARVWSPRAAARLSGHGD